MSFEPIAIVGQACTLPDALWPAALVANVMASRSAVSSAPAGRWRVPAWHAMGTQDERAWSDAGGYVRGFDEVFDPTGLLVPADEIRRLDPVFQWTLHTAREALRAVGHDGVSDRAGLVLGNLSFPSAAMAAHAEGVWLDALGDRFLGGHSRERAGVGRIHPKNRFMSGLPAHLTAEALGLRGGAFALDAACASSLYAIKLACDRLHDRSADLMLAGAVNAADSLFLHIGFCALSAMSRSGQSRPFHREADGLVPAEGAVFVALKRLADARAAGDRVLGVIRGVGLSNDGRGRGLLAPSEDGQVRALRLAYAEAGIAPSEVGLVECHATGTKVGDVTEVRTLTRVFEGCSNVPLGSLKSNLGHLITAAGGAGLLKILGAFQEATLPPTLHTDKPIAEIATSPFRLIDRTEPWPSGRRIGAVSAFGFGGNNAHLIVEQDDGGSMASAHVAVAGSSAPAEVPAVAIVGIGARIGNTTGALEAAHDLLGSAAWGGRRDEVSVALDGVRFPPRDLEQTSPQHLLVFEAAREAVAGLSLPRERTSVIIGMGCDPEVARYGARWRLPGWADTWASQGDLNASAEWLEKARDAVQPQHGAAGVVGVMPNIPANRINSQLDLAGPSFTVSSEEVSGVAALGIAARALRHGEIDAAIVGAVDLPDEPVHRAALGELGAPSTASDAAVVLVLKRLADVGQGERVLALIEGDPTQPSSLRIGDGAGMIDPFAAAGRPHAATGLANVAAAVLALQHGALLRAGRGACPWFGHRAAEVTTHAIGEQAATVRLISDRPAQPVFLEDPPAIHVFAGKDRADVLRAVAEGREASVGPARAVIVAASPEELSARRAQLLRAVPAGAPLPEGIAFCDKPVGGEVAFVFAGAAAAYPDMGRELLLAFPDAVASLAARAPSLLPAAAWTYGDPRGAHHALEQLWASSLLCQVHAEVSRDVLGLSPDAAIGYSSGESNSLFALGAWRDLDAMIEESQTRSLLTSDLAGDLAAPRRVWSRLGAEGTWAAWVVSASVDEVRRALAGEPLAHLTIINTPDECVIGGESAACARVIDKVGANRALPIPYVMAAHCPEIEEVRDAWVALHRRTTFDVPKVRFYSAGAEHSYHPTPDSAAAAITAQAVRTLDFPRVIEQAYADGVRAFVEHGPRGLCSRWIQRILGDREHVSVALDTAGQRPLRQLANAVASLVAAGVKADLEVLRTRFDSARPAVVQPSGSTLTLKAHAPAIQFPSPAGIQSMLPAPPLPPVLDGVGLSSPPVAVAPVPPAAPPSAEVLAPPPAAPVARPVFAPIAGIEAQPPIAPAAAPAFSPSSTTARALAVHAGVAEAHRIYVESQGSAHARFLSLHKTLMDRLLQGPHGGIALSPVLALGPVSAQPAPAPAQSFTAPAMLVPAQPVALPAAPTPVRVEAPPPVPAAAPRPTLAVVVRPASDARPVAVPPPPAPSSAPLVLPGPKFSRADLEVLASGKISSVLGPQFAGQDQYARQVRMPEPPLLLADRVTGIQGVPMSMGTGTIWTETDVRRDGWYIHEGRMPAGVMIESGQADLLLISWLGIDAYNKGERVYRLLGCEATYHGELPRPGDTLVYDIHVDGHAQQGDVRLFFFHYDCRVRGEVRLSVRRGQAGFFSTEELANSGGVLWDPLESPPPPPARLDLPLVRCEKSSFTAEEVRAFAHGDAFKCFGRGFERAQTHVRSPRIATGPMLLLDHVTDLDPKGGPWKRGYFRAETPFSPDDWFFQGHFKNDPCMPGTLIFEACTQAMAFYLCAMGYSLDRDGHVFEPVTGLTSPMRCRGQATPTSKLVVYEVFVRGMENGPTPTLYADLLCTVDGKKAFHAVGVGLRLVPDFPLGEWRHGPVAPQSAHGLSARSIPPLGGLTGYVEPKPVAVVNGFPFDYASLLACAWGKPSQAFGPVYERFDGVRRVARLPGPPYHFMSRIVAVDGPIGVLRVGTKCEVEYDVPKDAWYFTENGARTMPFCVLLEAALQPCGWLASYIGSALTTDIDLLFRNLDGTGNQLVEIFPDSGTLRTTVVVVDVSQSAGMIIESFEVECFLGDVLVYKMRTTFGFFPKEAFDNQVGLPVSADQRARIDALPTATQDLRARPPHLFAGGARLATPMLCMLDRVTALDLSGGAKGMGYARGEKDVNAGEWFFKAHFFQDPVQPGSLGVEALLQILQVFMIEAGMAEGIENPRFEPLAIGRPLTWKYRGQVVPSCARVSVEIDITERGEDERGRYAIAEGSLWVDGKRIYGTKAMAMRVVSGDTLPADPVPSAPPPGLVRGSRPLLASGPGETGINLTPVRDYWRRAIGVGPWPIEDLNLGLCQRFVGDVVLADAAAFDRIRGKGCLFLANHQVALESMVFVLLASALTSVSTAALAKTEHRESWMGRLVSVGLAYPGVTDPGLLAFFDREDHASFEQVTRALVADLAASRRSVLVHVEGTRSLSCRTPTARLSGAVIDMALAAEAPIVPVRFSGGLPFDEASERLDFPIGFTQQTIHIGTPIGPAELRAMPLKDRKDAILGAINALGPGAEELPGEPDRTFTARVAGRQARLGVSLEDAVFFETLAALPFESSESTARLLDADRARQPIVGEGLHDAWLSEFARSLTARS